VTEECEELVTTICTQKSTVKRVTASIKESTSRLTEKGEPKDIKESTTRLREERRPKEIKESTHQVQSSHAKRNAEAAHYKAGSSPVLAPKESVEPANCRSSTERQCKDLPSKTPRKQPREVCETVKDVTTVEECTETVITECDHEVTKSHVLSHEVKRV